ncbi:hypothetical protein PVAP13_2KG347917 [Panicum virgatum]|uniref:Uncharacterized protein n=1 Tax=Panicum virgatum TaxID=38727 RepID=A0A8T0W361_PANVG|nr:hypothetical protein PVAP13_2KG347917 [Panicum virgatum]
MAFAGDSRNTCPQEPRCCPAGPGSRASRRQGDTIMVPRACSRDLAEVQRCGRKVWQTQARHQPSRRTATAKLPYMADSDPRRPKPVTEDRAEGRVAAHGRHDGVWVVAVPHVAPNVETHAPPERRPNRTPRASEWSTQPAVAGSPSTE